MRNNFFWLRLSLVVLLSDAVLAEDLKIPEGSKFQPDTLLTADFWTYDIDGYSGNSSKDESIRREQIDFSVWEGKRTCSVTYFEVVGGYCREGFGGLVFRHGSSDDRGVELSCELKFISPDLIQLTAVQTTRWAHKNYLSRDTSLVTWAFDDKKNRWVQQAYQGTYFQETLMDEGIDYYGQRVPFSSKELFDNDYGIPIKCRGDTAWIYASPTP